MSNEIAFAVAAAAGWGTAAYLIKKAIDENGAYSTAVFKFAFCAALALPISFFAGELPRMASMDGPLLWDLALLMVLNGGATACFYKAAETGKISVAIAVSGSFAWITAIASAALLGETLSALQVFAVLLSVAGVFLVSAKHFSLSKGEKFEKNVGYALLAMLGWGASMVFFKPLSMGIGPINTAILNYLVIVALIAAIALAKKGALHSPKKTVYKRIGASSLFDVTGTVSYNVAMTTGLASTTTAIAAMFPAVTVGLAAIFLKEKISGTQWIGMAIVFASLALLSA